ncbi:unnamed protein product [Arabis nemorensis]|uniref:RNA helicase n=1 Tax=Arabis nemorensis TaxID=586526 RepID=A0A565AW38_9BRAS|nr:unnamed protein product [Arabis nemorensis]
MKSPINRCRLVQKTRSIPETVNVDRDQYRKRYRRHERNQDRDREFCDEKLAKVEIEKDLIAMKEQYLGTTKPKKRVIIKPSEKFCFSFDREKSEDTSKGEDMNVHEAQLLFGRGFRAGMDHHEQRAKYMNVDKHWKEKKLKEMNERDWRIFKEDFNISFKGTKIPLPMRNWEESIPLGLQQRDVIGIAETGSGKTVAFLLPMLAYISRLPPMSEENHMEDETVKFARYLGFRVTSVIGGESIEKQGLKLSQGCEIVIATPGRLLDCIERRATMPCGVEKLAKKYLRNPVVVTIGNAEKVTDSVSQQVIMIKESEKFSKLKKLIDELGDDKTSIVFANTQNKADSIVKNLEMLARFRVTTFHGGKSQELRKISLEGFRSKRFNILVVTNVMACGIDVPHVAHVINYDMPNEIEIYTHRIGRKGRAGKRGVATTFFLNSRGYKYVLQSEAEAC